MKSDRNLEVAKRAHAIWEQNGRPDGQAEQHWLQAEREFEAGNDNSASRAPAPKVAAPKEKAAKRDASRKPAASKKPTLAARAKQPRAATA